VAIGEQIYAPPMLINLRESLPTREAAALFGVSPSTLEKWRVLKKGPRYLKVAGRVRYLVADLEIYQRSCARNPESLPDTEVHETTPPAA
jgi:hypothetical protein